MKIKNLSDFISLPLNTRVYEPCTTDIKLYHYFGVNPRHASYIMLGKSENVNSIVGTMVGTKELHNYYTDYEEACKALYDQVQLNLNDIKNTFHVLDERHGK